MLQKAALALFILELVFAWENLTTLLDSFDVEM